MTDKRQYSPNQGQKQMPNVTTGAEYQRKVGEEAGLRAKGDSRLGLGTTAGIRIGDDLEGDEAPPSFNKM